ncbi:MAG TPA: hypothetical protein VGC36_15655, partial [Rhizomicrobium sp.]
MKIKIGDFEFDWTRTHSIVAGIAAVVILALIFNGSDTSTVADRGAPTTTPAPPESPPAPGAPAPRTPAPPGTP